jgi:DNA replication protein DnaC
MTELNPTEVKARLKALGLFGLLACSEEIAEKPWLSEVLAIEERERQKRGLERRLRNARVATFKPMTDFDWTWPKKIDREAIDELFALGFLKTGHNAVLVGPNGVGKTMILKNIAHQAVVRGHTVRFATASDMLADLAAQESSVALARRLRRYTIPHLLCIDEVGYLSYDNRYAVTDQPRRDARREESCPVYPRVFLKAAGVMSSSGRPKTSRCVPSRSNAQAR